MGNNWKKGLACMMAAGMMASLMPTQTAGAMQLQKESIKKKLDDDLTISTKQEEKNYAEGEAIVLYKGQASTIKRFGANDLGSDIEVVKTYTFEDIDHEAGTAKASSAGTISSGTNMYVSLVKSDQYTTKQLIQQLSSRDDVLIAEPNYRIKACTEGTDPLKKYQWALDNQGQNGGVAGVDLNADIEALNKDGDDKEKVIALVDTGIDYTHEDLAGVVWNNPFNNNKLRGEHGYDFINYDEDPLDDNGHGSHCSGIMAATANNGVGISGVATSKNIKIMGLKILDEEGYGYGMESIGAYNYIYQAQKLGVNIVAVNNSWGGVSGEESQILKELINLVGENGALSICAAGNESADNDKTDSLPANTDSPYVISVAASDGKGQLADFSNYGKKEVDIAAPGAAILSTVAIDTFNPGIYTDKSALCSVYQDFTSGNLVETMGEDVEPVELKEGDIAYGREMQDAKGESSLVSNEYFREAGENEKSLQWKITGAKEDEVYYLHIPYTASKSSTPLYESIMVRGEKTEELGEGTFAFWNGDSVILVCDSAMKEDGIYDEENEIEVGGVYLSNGWSHLSGEAVGKVRKEQQRVLSIQLLAAADGDYTINIDNLGISKSDVTSDQFGKYDYYSGTSMATPHVTAAVAAVANANPDTDALDRKATILGCSSKKEGMADKISTGGVLDFAGLTSPRASVESIQLNAEKNIEISGNYMDGAEVKVNDTVVEPLQQEAKKIVISGETYLNNKIKITLTKNGDVIEDEYFFVSGEQLALEERMLGQLYPGSLVSDGDKVYNVTAEGMVWTTIPFYVGEDKTKNMWTMYGNGAVYATSIFGKEYENNVECAIYNDSEVIYSNGKLWTILVLDTGFSQTKILVAFDEKEGWKKVADIPEEFEIVEGVTIGAYNGTIYLAGGFNTTTAACSTAVAGYNATENKWNKVADLPEARAFSKAVQVGNQFVVTLGCGDVEGYPANLIFDGEKWTTSQAQVKDTAYQEYSYLNKEGKEQKKSYVDAQIGMAQGSIIYVGNQVSGLGEIYTYQVKEDTYQASGYTLSDQLGDKDIYLAATAKDKLYVLTGEYEEISWEDFYFDFSKKASAEDDDDDKKVVDEDDIEEGDICVNVFTVPVTTGYIEVKDESKEGASVDGAGFHLPGDTITLTPVVPEDCYVKSFTVNGQAVKANAEGKYEYTHIADDSQNGLKTATELGYYVMGIMAEEEIEVLQGSEYPMYSEVYPEMATNKKLKWESADTSVAKVDENGVITIPANAKVGAQTKITVTATDRGTVKAECIVTVGEAMTAELPAKNSKQKVGSLTYKVTKSAEKNGTVSCVAANSKKATKVIIPDTVKINGYTFKVTKVEKNAFKGMKKLTNVTVGKNVTAIGSNAWKNCAKLKTVKIKSTKIKSIGKGAFSGIHKKATITVPAKQKKTYSKKLKTAGFTGTVK